MKVRHGRDIVTFKHVIELKANDEELGCLIKDSQLILKNLEPYKDEIEDSPTIKLLRSLAELQIPSR